MKKEINMFIKKETNNEIKPGSFATHDRINTDPNGTWTGVNSENQYEQPIQDADDL